VGIWITFFQLNWVVFSVIIYVIRKRKKISLIFKKIIKITATQK